MQILDRGGELVAYALELPEVEQRRSAAHDAGHAVGRGDVREALRDDRRALALQSRDLRPQRCPRGALAERAGQQASVALRAGTVVSRSVEQSLAGAFSIALSLLVVAHTRLLSGRRRFYQRARAR
jgi:hypothetical protein